MNDSLENILDRIITEALGSDIKLQEKDKQVHLASKSTSQEPDSGEKKQDPKAEKKIDDKENDDDQAMASVPNVEQISEKLNSIRSGRSLRDSGVKDRFEGYINDLKDNEKVALFTFLKGISQIITGDVSSQDAVEPEDKPADIHMHKKKIQQVKKKPNVQKIPDTVSKEKKKPGSEDTAPPISVKR